MVKEICYNVPRANDELANSKNYTMHVGGVSIRFDEIQEHNNSGYTFHKDGVETAFVPANECSISPVAAMKVAEDTPNKMIRFADN